MALEWETSGAAAAALLQPGEMLMNQSLKILVAAMILASAGAISACNTVEGAGKDIERAGEKVQDANCSSNDTSCRQ
jgi:predicted small secreted protein